MAARLFAELGYTACEMERVAAELGIAKGTLYLYFSSKETLFYACVDAGMRQMQSVVLAAADEATDLIDRLSRGIRAYLQFFEDHPEHVELLIQERANFKSRSRPTYFEYREQNRQKWRPVHEEMIASGRYRTDIPVERIMDAIGNLLYGTMFTNHFVGRAVSLNEQYQSLLEILMRGLLSEEERGCAIEVPTRRPERVAAEFDAGNGHDRVDTPAARIDARAGFSAPLFVGISPQGPICASGLAATAKKCVQTCRPVGPIILRRFVTPARIGSPRRMTSLRNNNEGHVMRLAGRRLVWGIMLLGVGCGAMATARGQEPAPRRLLIRK